MFRSCWLKKLSISSFARHVLKLVGAKFTHNKQPLLPSQDAQLLLNSSLQISKRAIETRLKNQHLRMCGIIKHTLFARELM